MTRTRHVFGISRSLCGCYVTITVGDSVVARCLSLLASRTAVFSCICNFVAAQCRCLCCIVLCRATLCQVHISLESDPRIFSENIPLCLPPLQSRVVGRETKRRKGRRRGINGHVIKISRTTCCRSINDNSTKLRRSELHQRGTRACPRAMEISRSAPALFSVCNTRRNKSRHVGSNRA